MTTTDLTIKVRAINYNSVTGKNLYYICFGDITNGKMINIGKGTYDKVLELQNDLDNVSRETDDLPIGERFNFDVND